ncbi:Fe(3+)-hydroxamate ABC transporter permease FhuB [Chenggangzhangella methanolivorans]|uniref:Fe(3+)-hydroxamate ABC transporter permease FhuB n=1 Tax=Chenggangzhangella methanolivorans TaxID=1437009 RepID=UPI00360A5374
MSASEKSASSCFSRVRSPGLLALAVAAPALVATLIAFDRMLPPELWIDAVLHPDLTDLRQVAFAYSAVPRALVSLVAGAALGLAGALLQIALRNPIAEPATLGTFAGAGLALSAATLFAPWMLGAGAELVALGGAAAATGLAVTLAGRQASPVRLALGGLVVTLTCGAATAAMVTLTSDDMAPLFVWQSGSLAQDGGPAAFGLTLRLALGCALALVLVRPLSVLGLSDAAAGALGVRPGTIRLAAVTLAVALSASVAAMVGVIGFVGLAAPALARLGGAQSVGSRLFWSSVLGAATLWLADRFSSALPFPQEVPTGAVTALVGAPLVVLLLRRLRADPWPLDPPRSTPRDANSAFLLLLLAAGLAVGVVSLTFGCGLDGWDWTRLDGEIAALRAPRVAAAFGAGALLGIAGAILQRVTRNPLAAPETLGVSAGAMLGVLAMLVLTTGFDRASTVVAASIGSLATLVLVAAAGRGSAATPERILLAGVAAATMASGFAALFLASGDPRALLAYAWMAGSTYRTGALEAGLALTAGLTAIAVSPLASRVVEALGLGETSAASLGLAVGKARAALVLGAAVMTALATVAMGPLTFVGLLAPHAARLLGFRRASAHLPAAGLVGGGLLTLADFAGRNVIFPWQIPGGVVASLLGGAYMLARLWRESSQR